MTGSGFVSNVASSAAFVMTALIKGDGNVDRAAVVVRPKLFPPGPGKTALLLPVTGSVAFRARLGGAAVIEGGSVTVGVLPAVVGDASSFERSFENVIRPAIPALNTTNRMTRLRDMIVLPGQ